MSDLNELKKTTAATLLKQINEAAEGQLGSSYLKDLAEAYVLVAGAAPKEKSTSGGVIY